MGAPLGEFVLEGIIRDGLGDLRSNPDKLNDLFSVLTETYLANQYGQAKIDEIKTYIVNNQIKIVQGWAMVPMAVPCISIELAQSSEDADLQEFSNMYEDVDTAKTPTVIIDPFLTTSYDPITGKVVIDPSSDLAKVKPGQIFVDNSGTKFRIQSGNSNSPNNKFVNIGKDKNPDLGANSFIESSIDITRTDRRMIRDREVFRIGCHASNDIHLTKFIYTILKYILKSRQITLEQRGIHLDRGIGSIYAREDQFQGEHIFSRFIEMHCFTEFSWDQEEVNLIDTFDDVVKTEMPEPITGIASKVNTSDD